MNGKYSICGLGLCLWYPLSKYKNTPMPSANVIDPTKISAFNSYFSTIAENLQQKIVFGDNNFTRYLNTTLESNFLNDLQTLVKSY